jgi:hypothetical protein
MNKIIDLEDCIKCDICAYEKDKKLFYKLSCKCKDKNLCINCEKEIKRCPFCKDNLKKDDDIEIITKEEFNNSLKWNNKLNIKELDKKLNDIFNNNFDVFFDKKYGKNSSLK